VDRFRGEDIFIEPADSLIAGDGPITDEDMPFHRGKLANVIFSNEEKREAMNAIVHPAVKSYVQQAFEEEQQKGQLNLLVLEAALLIEEDYGAICDELWYIYTSEENRRIRLKQSRGYSDEKIDSIFNSQLTEAQFRAGTQVTIDNNGNLEETFRQIENALRRQANE
jgi:dephospho-CoA kinase